MLTIVPDHAAVSRGVFVDGVAAGQDDDVPPRPQTRSVFDAAAREYDAARPSYPPELYAELERVAGPLAGRLVLDWGAGTGIAARQLAALGARVGLFDLGEQMLRHARARDPGAACVLADGTRMPVRTACADLVTFAQSWHWFAAPDAPAEVARVLRPGGYWSAWWNRASANGEPWFERYQDVLEAGCPQYIWRDLSDELMAPDWTAAAVTAVGMLEPVATTVVPWTRRVSAAQWLTDERSKSYVIDLEPRTREAMLSELAGILAERFPDGELAVRYVTTLLIAQKR
jgi:ubiquinone/menaquinone biosynthesis C-methylase UbiE